MSIEPDVKPIIKMLQHEGIITLVDPNIGRMSGSTDGLVYTLLEDNEPKYVIKLDSPQQITYVEQFFHAYPQVALLPKLLYTDRSHKYIVYSYLAGTTHYNRGSKIDWMTVLVEELFNHYKKSNPSAKWGRLGLPRQSWREFNRYSVEAARINLGSLLPEEDYSQVNLLVDRMWEEPDEKYLLHGDTGVHNFVFKDSTLTGIIDPSPMVGPLIYDFTYAFCSSPDDMDLETLFGAFSSLNYGSMERSRLIEEVIVQLYNRMGICAKVHPHDWEDYLKAWEYWRILIK
ncbi:phosphotransferase [Paenibacillus sp. LMG 31456]|uniref:Phosphotransferase n=1 Tax=Paenibacillus foliorum TaxID=2654974 RepID=A0A972JXF8_9BACL|nr:phosphotransferase [Paenibacillus foliorum]NOU92424.1 phosphotransferase [Paenibacillus foliorum]